MSWARIADHGFRPLLTDDELRIAAASRPGYATYPQYRPTRPLVFSPRRDTGRPRWRPRWQWRVRTVAGRRLAGYAWTQRSAQRRATRAAGPAPEPTSAPAAPFAFRPTRAADPWWRPRWQWAVISAAGQTAHGRTWTEVGAYRRSTRQARRWSR